MSRENIEVLRRSFDALERGDLAGVLDSLSENVELRQPPEFPGAETAHGHEGYLKARAELEEAARDIRYEAQELIDAGNQAIAVVRFKGHARYTDLPIDVLVYWVYTFRGGKVVQMDVYLDREKALDAAGLPASDEQEGYAGG